MRSGLVQPLWRGHWKYQSILVTHTLDPTIPLLGTCSTKAFTGVQRSMSINAHCYIVHKNEKLWTPKMSMSMSNRHSCVAKAVFKRWACTHKKSVAEQHVPQTYDFICVKHCKRTHTSKPGIKFCLPSRRCFPHLRGICLTSWWEDLRLPWPSSLVAFHWSLGLCGPVLTLGHGLSSWPPEGLVDLPVPAAL